MTGFVVQGHILGNILQQLKHLLISGCVYLQISSIY